MFDSFFKTICSSIMFLKYISSMSVSILDCGLHWAILLSELCVAGAHAWHLASLWISSLWSPYFPWDFTGGTLWGLEWHYVSSEALKNIHWNAERERIFHLLVHSLNACGYGGWCGLKPEDRNSIWIPREGSRIPTTWSLICCLPRTLTGSCVWNVE